MVLKEFHIDVPGRGKVNVEFRLHFDSRPATVGEIKVHSDFDCGIPHKVQLRQDLGYWKLYAEHPVKENGEIAVVPEFLNDDLSITIANRIVNIRENES